MTAAFAPGSALAYLRAHRDQAVNAVATLVRIPTVSAQKEHRPHLDHCAQWLRNHLARIGLAYARLVSTPTGGPPLVMAEWTGAAGRPTVLIYGHYDVQPADAGEGEVWEDPPFAGITRGDELRGRGASDNKGQFFAHLAAIEAQLATTGRLPVNVRCLFEGEEEIGSPGLLAVTGSRPELFSADVAVISDMPMVGPDYPAITYALRGLLSAEVTIERPGPSLHAGLFGGAVSDPIHALCRLAATLRMPDGRINLPNFYADVREVDATDRREMAQIATLGGGPRHHDVGGGEPDFTPIERTTIRPAMTVTAFQGGYMGTGIKSAIARVARLDLDLRLVPDQRSDAALAGLRKHCAALAMRGQVVRLQVASRSEPLLLDRTHPAMGAAARACQRVFGRPPCFRRSSGTIPFAGVLAHELGVTPLLLGFALPDDNIHGPNERLHLPTFFRAMDLSLALLQELAAVRP